MDRVNATNLKQHRDCNRTEKARPFRGRLRITQVSGTGGVGGAKLSFDNSVEVTSRKGVSGTSSLTVAPYGALDSNAVLLRVEGTGSEYRYTNNDPPPAHVNGRSIDASVLAGLQAVYENFTAAIFLGGELAKQ